MLISISPRIPAGISKEAKDFFNRCFVRNSKSRWNHLEYLLSHPFLKEDISDAAVILSELMNMKIQLSHHVILFIFIENGHCFN
ncbi:hypothetical protein Sjap_000414 [Stephania japonica]|uniref:Uncharacterized protein n=1 Tax=Stephania japonica TaxID=461633 RepID=A0AAP0PSG1_9MAGN